MAFAVVKDRGIVESLWSFAEPTRWRDAHLNPDLFKGLMPQDFVPLAGCDLIWTKKEGRFVGANDPDTCRASSSAGGPLRMNLRAELTADELAVAEQSYESSGRRRAGQRGRAFLPVPSALICRAAQRRSMRGLASAPQSARSLPRHSM